LLDTFKKLALKSSLIRLTVAILIAVVLLAITDFGIFLKLKGPIDLSQIDKNDLNKQYVKTEMPYTIGYYAEKYTQEEDSYTKNTTHYYYYVPVYTDDTLTTLLYYVGVQVAEKDRQPYEASEFIGEFENMADPVHIEGTLQPMNPEEKNYYLDALYEADYSPEDIETYALPYRINKDYLGRTPAHVTYLLSTLAALCLLYGVLVILKFMLGTYRSQLNKFTKTYPDANQDALEFDFQSANTVDNKIWVGRKYTLYFDKQKIRVLKNSDVLWAYYYEYTIKRRGSTTVKHYVVTYNKDKKSTRIGASSRFACEKILDTYSKTQPHMVLGYTEELANMFQNNIKDFIALSQNQEAQVQQESASTNEF